MRQVHQIGNIIRIDEVGTNAELGWSQSNENQGMDSGD